MLRIMSEGWEQMMESGWVEIYSRNWLTFSFVICVGSACKLAVAKAIEDQRINIFAIVLEAANYLHDKLSFAGGEQETIIWGH